MNQYAAKGLFGAAMLAAVIAAGTTTAAAGEITGNGKPITVHAASECAFSGLDDPDEDPFGRVQSFGQIVRQMGPLGGVPGFACNPSGARG